MVKVLVSFSCFFLFACSHYQSIHINKQLKSEELQIVESVFRYMIHSYKGEPMVYRLSVGLKQDAPDGLLALLQDLPNVKKYSDCELKLVREGDPIGFATERETGRSAFILTIKAIEWKNSSQVRAKVSSFRGSLVAGTSYYYLSRMGAQWVVRKRKLVAIS